MDGKLKAAAVVILGGLLACLCVSAQILNAIIGTAGSGAGQNFTFYVSQSTGSDSNPGTQAQPFQTISKVNSLALTAGQSVGFKAGDTWREQLNLPASGSSGRPITFGAYGSGNKPIINGSDLITGTWTQTRVTQMSDTMNHNGSSGAWTLTGTGVSFTSNQLQVVMTATSGTHRATDKFTATPISTEAWFTYQIFVPSGYSVPDGTDGFISGLYQSSSGNAVATVGYHSVAGVLKWKGFYANNSGGFIGMANIANTITTNATHTILGHVIFASGTGSYTYWVDGVQIDTSINLANNLVTADTMQMGENFTGTTVTVSGFYTNTAVYTGTDSANVWQTALTTQPNLLAFNSTITGPGGISSVPTSYNSVDENWFWSGNVIYLSSTSIPSTRFTSVEAASRNSDIDTAGKSWVTITGLSLQKSNGSTNGGLTIGTSSHITLQSCEAAYNANAGVYIISGAGGSLLINGNNIHDNGDGVLAYQYSGAAAGSELVISYNTIANNGYVTYSTGSFWQFPEGIQVYGNYSIIEHNTVSGNGNINGDSIAVHLYADSSLTYGNHNIIRYNTISGQISDMLAASDGSGIETDNYTDNNQIYYNTVYGNWGPCIDVYASTNTTVANNSCYNNVQNPIFLFPGELLTSDFNNLVGPTPNNVFENNIAYATRSGVYAIYVDPVMAGKTNTYTTNLLYDTGQANWYFWNASGGNILATFNALPGVTGNLNGNPLYTSPGTNDFTLQAGSPAINAGTCIGGVTPCPTNIGSK